MKQIIPEFLQLLRSLLVCKKGFDYFRQRSLNVLGTSAFIVLRNEESLRTSGYCR